ncbi:type II toxin-antitoxin system HicB family antitoxin [Skermania sp. ID1734]|uniref:type II toxin-antitoxin system HicB family antitoxin n=1 Tax=Skermania sp. ID1734 TaxID=2597516 RepID=UPI00117FFCA5|nr:type II toxin-antitoxin system HicB family antitoxin [Skermania sp. ID1734]TSD96520.1 type II toxin-antitoxin system HicB family antitoxin [Skermania sp. ID1734]
MSLHYSYRVFWSPEDDEFVGTCLEFPSLSHLDADPGEALRGIVDLVEFTVKDLQDSGEPVPTPLADRTFSGNFMIRTSPDLHRRLTIEASEQGVSLNKFVNEKLANA